MSGASGRVPAAIHVTPEAVAGGAIGKIHNGDIIRVDAVAGTLEVKVDNATLSARAQATAKLDSSHVGLGRELFARFREAVNNADAGASIFGDVA
jgi:phosphogluconate dehydratase